MFSKLWTKKIRLHFCHFFSPWFFLGLKYRHRLISADGSCPKPWSWRFRSSLPAPTAEPGRISMTITGGQMEILMLKDRPLPASQTQAFATYLCYLTQTQRPWESSQAVVPLSPLRRAVGAPHCPSSLGPTWGLISVDWCHPVRHGCSVPKALHTCYPLGLTALSYRLCFSKYNQPLHAHHFFSLDRRFLQRTYTSPPTYSLFSWTLHQIHLQLTVYKP